MHIIIDFYCVCYIWNKCAFHVYFGKNKSVNCEGISRLVSFPHFLNSRDRRMLVMQGQSFHELG